MLFRSPRPRLRARCAAVGRPCPRSRVAAIAAAAAGYASPAAARSDSAHRRPPSLSFCKNTVYSTRRTHSRAHTLTHTHTQTRARARTQTHTHTPHTYTHARTHALTRARNPGPPRAHARERASEQDAHTRRAKFRSLAWLLGTFTRYGEAGARAAPGNRAWPSWCERSPEPAGGGAGDWRAAGGLEGGGGPEGGGGDRRVAGAGRASRRRLPRRPLPLSLSLAHTLSYSIYFAALERGRRKPGGAGAEGGKVAVPGRCLLSPDEPPRVWKKKVQVKKKIKEKEKKSRRACEGMRGGPRCGRPNLGVLSPRGCAGVGWVGDQSGARFLGRGMKRTRVLGHGGGGALGTPLLQFHRGH